MKDKQELVRPTTREKAYQQEGWKQEETYHLPILREGNTCSRQEMRLGRQRGASEEI